MESLASTLYHARNGGRFAQALAAVRVATQVAAHFDPDPVDDMWRMLSKWTAPGNLAIEEDHQGGWAVRQETWSADYVGDPSPEAIAQRLERLNATRGTILLVGPSGSGKSTLARSVGTCLHPTGRQIRLPGAALSKPSGSRLLRRIVDSLKPAVLIVDDVNISPSNYYERKHDAEIAQVLDSLQWLHGKLLVALTVMDDSVGFAAEVANGKFGVCYYPGMRPGRVDLVIPMPPPNAKQRAVVLRHYGLAPTTKQIKATQGLTPAYLAEFARRAALAPDEWADELRQLRVCAPRIRPPHGRRAENAWTYRRFNKVEDRLDALEAAARSAEPPGE